jgi:hypothetical protein
MDFIKGLYEARMLRDENNAKVLTYTDCCERLYLSLLMLEFMRYYPQTRNFVKSYASITKKNDYKNFRLHSTDLYNLIYFVDGDEEAMNKLKDPEAAKKTRAQVFLPLVSLNRYLTQLSNDSQPIGVSETLTKLESNLKITNSDYKNIRRVILNIRGVSEKEKSQAATKLLLAARAKLRNSDLIDDYEKLIASKDLESNKVQDNEPKVSVPDLTPSSTKLLYYQYIVGKENIALTRLFMQMARDGKSIPPQYVKGYLPAIKMLDDIVSAGPAYISALRALHQRAKKGSK